MLIGVISDTHFPHKMSEMPKKLSSVFNDVSLILHAGDIHDLEALQMLSRIAPTVAVAGNGDTPALANILGYHRSVFVEGIQIGLVHGHQGHPQEDPINRADQWFTNADIIVSGHSHLPSWQQLTNGVWHLNPGSCGVPKDSRGPSVAILEIANGRIAAEIIYLDE